MTISLLANLVFVRVSDGMLKSMQIDKEDKNYGRFSRLRINTTLNALYAQIKMKVTNMRQG